ncbi:MAG: glycosyltransferase family 39 protein [Planctomycetes bacterium]|nr:glycosyltransferase family 39 protein [Planctomycetota bacterium]
MSTRIDAPTRRRPSGALLDPVALTIALLAAALYAATAAARLTPDSLVYAHQIAVHNDLAQLLHPHHLAFAPVVRGLVDLTGLGPVAAARLHNVAWSVLALLALHALLRRLGIGRPAASLATAACAICSGFWAFATQVEVYAPAIACQLAAACTLASGTPRRRTWLVASAWLTAGVLYHQTAVLLAVAVVPLAIAARGDATRATASRRGLAVLALAGVASLTLYVAASRIAPGSRPATLRGFLDFCMHYAVKDAPGWGTLANFSPKGAHLLAHSATCNVVELPPAEFSTTGYVAAVLGAALLALLGIRALQVARRRSEFRMPLAAFGAWLGAQWLFAWWFLPREEELQLGTLPGLCTVAAIVTVHSGAPPARERPVPTRLAIAWLALGALGAWNLFAGALPRRSDPGPAAASAVEFARIATPDTVLLVPHAIYAEYLFRRLPGRPVLYDAPFLALYRDPHSRPEPSLQSAARVLVPFELVRPDHATWVHSPVAEPGGYRAVIGWLAGVAQDGTDGALRHAHLGRRDLPLGPVLLVEPTERSAGGVDVVLAELDALDPGTTPRYSTFSRD